MIATRVAYPEEFERIVAFYRDSGYGPAINPADVIVSLREGYYCGSRFFSAMVNVASTHGSLTRRGSTAFALSNHSALPPRLRLDDLRPYVASPGH